MRNVTQHASSKYAPHGCSHDWHVGYATVALMLGDELPTETQHAAPKFVDAKKVVRAQALAEGLSLLLVDLETLRLA